MLFSLLLFVLLVTVANSFCMLSSSKLKTVQTVKVHMSITNEVDSYIGLMSQNHFNTMSMFLSDTSISEEDVINVTGQTANLPDPLIPVGVALVIFIGVGILQFSLGDLTKEEGQARVRDFLQTKKNTERKRGYFD